MSSTTGRSTGVVRINEIIDRLLKDVETSSVINKSLYDSVTVREISEWEKIEKRVHALGKTDPKKSNKLASELLDRGYYTMNLFRLMAMNYRSQDQLKDELQFLLRVKKDYNFNDFDPRLR